MTTSPTTLAHAAATALRRFVRPRALPGDAAAWPATMQRLLDEQHDSGYLEAHQEPRMMIPTKIDGKRYTLRPRPPADWLDREIATRGEDMSGRYGAALVPVDNTTAPLAQDVVTALLWAGFDASKLPEEADDNALLLAAGNILATSPDFRSAGTKLHENTRVTLPPLRPENVRLTPAIRNNPWYHEVTFYLDFHNKRLGSMSIPDRKDTGVSAAKLVPILRRVWGVKDPNAQVKEDKKRAGAQALAEKGDVIATRLRFHQRVRRVIHKGWLANGAPYYMTTTNEGQTVYYVRRVARTPGAADYGHATAVTVEERAAGRPVDAEEREDVILALTGVAKGREHRAASEDKRHAALRALFQRLRDAGAMGVPVYTYTGQGLGPPTDVDHYYLTSGPAFAPYYWLRVKPGKVLKDAYIAADYGAGTVSKWEDAHIPTGITEARYDISYARGRGDYPTEWGAGRRITSLPHPDRAARDAQALRDEAANLRALLAAYEAR